MDEIINETMIVMIESINLLNESVIELTKVVAVSNDNAKPRLVVDNDEK